MVTNPIDVSSDMISFDFLQNEYVKLLVKEFKSIRIRIADVSGKTVKCDSDIATRLQMMFINVWKLKTTYMRNFEINGKIIIEF